MRLRMGLGCLAITGAITLTPLMAPPAPAGAADGPAEAQFVSYINNQRVSAGLPALDVSPDLVGIARNWSDHLQAAGRLSHNPDLVAQVPAGWDAISENVGMGSNVDSLNGAFWNSPEHRANILGGYGAIGVGVDIRSDGMIFVTVDFARWRPGASPALMISTTCVNSNPPANPSPSAGHGYYVLGSDGGVFSYGNAPFLGSVPGLGLRARTVVMAIAPFQHGYWVLGSDGGVFSFGDAQFAGSLPGIGVATNGVDMKPTISGNGYWVLGSDGGVFSFGDAKYFGSLPGIGVQTRAVKLVPTPSGHGYWVLGSDGGVFSFGDAQFAGSLPGIGVGDSSISLASTPSGNGYWVLGSDGGIFNFGDAGYYGSVPGFGCQQAIGAQLVPSVDGNGYDVLSLDGRVFSFGDAAGYGQPAGLGVVALDLGLVK